MELQITQFTTGYVQLLLKIGQRRYLQNTNNISRSRLFYAIEGILYPCTFGQKLKLQACYVQRTAASRNIFTPVSEHDRIYSYNVKQTSDEITEKFQLGDTWLIQNQILRANIVRVVWQTVGRIANETLGVKGLRGLLVYQVCYLFIRDPGEQKLFSGWQHSEGSFPPKMKN